MPSQTRRSQLHSGSVHHRARPPLSGLGTSCSPEHDLHQLMPVPSQSPRPVVDLSFVPNTIASLRVPDSDATLLGVGGLEAQIHLSLYDSKSSRQEPGSSSGTL